MGIQIQLPQRSKPVLGPVLGDYVSRSKYSISLPFQFQINLAQVPTLTLVRRV